MSRGSRPICRIGMKMPQNKMAATEGEHYTGLARSTILCTTMINTEYDHPQLVMMARN